MATPQDVLGSRLISFFKDNYSAGVWTDDINGAQMSQGTAGFRPTAGTLPDGSLDLSLDGVDDRLFGQFATTSPSGGSRLYFLIGSISSLSTSRQVWLRSDPAPGGNLAVGVDLPIAGNNNLYFQSSGGTQNGIGGNYRDNTRHRIIYIENVDTNEASYSIDRGALVALSNSTAISSDPFFSASNARFGTNGDDTARLLGTLAKVGFAWSASAFTQGDVDALHDALNVYLTPPLVAAGEALVPKTSGRRNRDRVVPLQHSTRQIDPGTIDVQDPKRFLIAQDSSVLWDEVRDNWFVYADKRSSRRRAGAVFNQWLRQTTQQSPVDPVTLPLSGWWKASYSGVPWVKNASAGTSGSSVDLTTNTTQPTTGTAVNGLTPATFNGSTLSARALTDMNSLLTNTAWSTTILFNPNTIINDTGAAYDLPALISDSQSGPRMGIALRTTGGTPQVFAIDFNGGTYGYCCPTTVTLSAWQVVQAKWNGTTLSLRVNGGARSTSSATFFSFSTVQMFVGQNYGGTRFFDGSILEILTMTSTISDADEDGVLLYMRNRYGLALT